MPAYVEFVLFLSLSPKELDPSFDVHAHTHTHTHTTPAGLFVGLTAFTESLG